MARYNSALASNSISGATTIGSPYNGAFTNLTGTAPYTVTLPSPGLFPGTNQTFYNATSGTVTLSSPSGNFNGTGGSSASTIPVYAGNVVSVTSDGTNYIVISEDGSALVATSGSFSGTLTVQASGSVNIAPGSAGNIDNVAIGSSTRAAGAFTTLTANGLISTTANIASTSTTTGALVVTGGIGSTGSIYSGGTVSATSLTATNVTGTLQTAAQPNITSTGGLTAPQLILAPSPSNQVAIIRRSAVSGSNGIRIQANISDAVPNDANAGAYIIVGGGVIGDTYEGNIDIVAYGGNVDANRNQIRFSNRSGTDTITERMRINKDGLVGIATPSPVATLDVRGGLAVSGWSNNNGGSAGGLEAGWDGSQTVLQSYNRSGSAYTPILLTGSTIKLAPSGSSRLFVNSTGVGINLDSPAAKLHIVNSTVSGIGSVPSGTSALIDSGSFNYLTFRSTADNGTNAGIAFQDNNIGGYVVFRNYDVNNTSISDRMFLAGYQGVNIQYGTADSVDVSARTNVAKFDSTGLSVVSGSLTVSDLNFNLGSEFQSISRAYTAPGSGPREIFRVPSSWLCTNGIFSLSATRNSFVHGSMWSWTTTHNGSGQGTLTMLSSGNYTNITVYLDVESGGGAVISADWGAQEGFQVTILKMSGGAISFASNGTDWSSPEAGRTRYSKATLANGFKAQNGAFDGSLSKGSGSFRIDHPLPALTETHALVHSFIEGPQADLIYRGRVNLVNGSAQVNIDEAANMTEGTFEALCRDVQCFTTNESDWTAVRGSVTGNMLTIEAESNTATSSVSWMVIGERKDKHMYNTEWTDAVGKVIVEPLKNPVQNTAPYPEEVSIFNNSPPEESAPPLEE